VATLTVWEFAEPDGAERALASLQEQALVRVVDVATVWWPADALTRPGASRQDV
jgi:hypothetical protein